MENEAPACDAATEISLPPRLDTAATESLRAMLLERRGSDLVVRADHVEQLGGLCLQVLLATQETWACDGCTLTYGPVSEAFDRDLKTLGVDAKSLEH